jgi:phosphatidylglycerol---prolipoprotein diacylglyceryl transferase
MHRILVQIGPLTVYSYGLMLALAFMAGMYLAQKRARYAGIDPQLVLDLTFNILLSSVIGARLFYVLLNWDYFKDNLLKALKVWEGGLVFYGGLLLALAVTGVFLRRHKISFWAITDVFSPSLALGIAIGRIGCFLNGCCYGKISEQGGICFPAAENAPAFVEHVAKGLVSPAAAYSLPVIPTQIYDSLSGLIIFVILLFLERRKRFSGFLFLCFMLLYSVSRFYVESLRSYEQNFIILGGITVSQLISLILGVSSAALLIFRSAAVSRHSH